jgi:23S rRNA-/tRNA-specific pseudouridylate synthase
LRVHMKAMGSPILGDVFYGELGAGTELCLHAYRIEFLHPSRAERVSFEAPIPQRFQIFSKIDKLIY